jgi:hypothetical protein
METIETIIKLGAGWTVIGAALFLLNIRRKRYIARRQKEETKKMNVEYLFSHMKKSVKGRSIYQIFAPPQIESGLPFAAYPPGTCIFCGEYMSPKEIKPSGAITKRAMHDACFAQLRQYYYRPNHQGLCIVCGLRIDDTGQQRGQAAGTPDIHHWVHKEKAFGDGMSCEKYFIVASAHGLGIRTGIIESEAWRNGRRRIIPDQRRTQHRHQAHNYRGQTQGQGYYDDDYGDDAIEAEYWETTQRRPNQNSQGQRMLAHNPPERFTFGVRRPDHEYVRIKR